MAKTCKSGYYWCYTDKKCKKIPLGWHVGRGGIIEKDKDENGEENKNQNGNSDSNGDGGGVTEDLRKWFGTGKEGGVGGGGWDEYNTKGERTGKCARGEDDDGEGPKPKCLSKEKAAKMTKSQIAAAVKRKRKKDPVADRPGKGGKPKMVSNKIDEGILDRLRGKKKPIQVGTKATYGGMTQDQIRTQNQQRNINTQTKNKVNNGTYDDPWLRSSPHGEKKYHYRQLRGEEMSLSRMSEAKKQPDHEHSMIRSELETIRKAVDRLKSKMKGEGNVEAWVQSKITKAADYIDSAADYIESGEHNVHGSMDEAKKDPCWKGYKQVGMKKKGNKEVPNCVPESAMPPAIDPKKHRKQQRAAKIRTLAQKGSTEGERAAAEKKTKGPKMFGEDLKLVDKILLEIEAEVLNEKNVPTNPSLWSKMKARAKAKFDVYPSAYANGWAAKEYKKAGGGWKSVSEEYEEERDEVCPYCGCDPCECEGVEIEEATRMPAKTGNLMYVMVTWRGKGYSMKVFFPQLKRPTRKEVEDKMQGVYPGSKVRHIEVINMKPGEQFLQVSEGAAWTKKEGKSEAGGLNEKGRKSYERENPGSDLKAPSKQVGNPRRASFCARMKGMKKKLTSAKTANDPDSRINKSLRAWNC